ncbi:MAG: DUF4837 family protein [Cyclobacteriaceae bacterium]
MPYKTNLVYCSWIVLAYLSSCSFDFDESGVLPSASGEAGEVVLVMDSAKWAGDLGDEIRRTFRSPVPGLLQDEPLFDLVYVDPYKLTNVLRGAKNLIFVTSLEGNNRGDQVLKNYFTQESLQRIENDSSLFMYTKEDEWAKGQSVLHLFQKNNEMLLDKIVTNRQKLQNHFIDIDKERLRRAVYKPRRQKNMENILLEEHQFFIQVPYGYRSAINNDKLVWLRQVGQPVDKNFFITYTDYQSESEFLSENLVKFRNRKWRSHLLGDDSLSYMVVQPLAQLDTAVVNFQGKYSVTLRGSWKLKNNSMGGPFISHAFVDETQKRLYYIEGFVYAPGKDKRDLLREMEVILATFRSASDLEKEGQSS